MRGRAHGLDVCVDIVNWLSRLSFEVDLLIMVEGSKVELLDDVGLVGHCRGKVKGLASHNKLLLVDH